MTLLSADYGIEGNRTDVTCRVQSLVQGGYLRLRIMNYALGGNPVPEQPKQFRLRARDYRGRIYDFNMLEKEAVALQLTDRGPNCPNTGTRSQWQGRLSDDDQERFDSYYTRWLSYRQRNHSGRNFKHAESHVRCLQTLRDSKHRPLRTGGLPHRDPDAWRL